MTTICPRPLQPGETIAIVSPASIIKPERVEGAVRAITRMGYRAEVMPHALGRSGTYAAPAADRLADMTEALTRPDVRAVICSRGGYGCVHLLNGLSKIDLRRDPKWVVGYSDVSAIHALLASKGIASVHGSMSKILTEYDLDYEPTARLVDIFRGRRDDVEFAVGEYSRPGVGQGRLLGGNLAVLQALMRTPFDIFLPQTVLFIEDIAEPIYKVERILWQLRLAGILDRLAGLVVGQFTEYQGNDDYMSMYDMVRDAIGELDIPVAYDAPIGHIDGNTPLIHGLDVRLSVTPQTAKIEYLC